MTQQIYYLDHNSNEIYHQSVSKLKICAYNHKLFAQWPVVIDHKS